MRRFHRKCATYVTSGLRSFPKADAIFRLFKKSQLESDAESNGSRCGSSIQYPATRVARPKHQSGIEGKVMIDAILTLAIVLTVVIINRSCSLEE